MAEFCMIHNLFTLYDFDFIKISWISECVGDWSWNFYGRGNFIKICFVLIVTVSFAFPAPKGCIHIEHPNHQVSL